MTSKKVNTWEPNYDPGWIFWTMIFYNLKKFTSRSSSKGSNFILSSLEVGHCELLKHSFFLTNYLKSQILASYNNLRIGQDSEFAKF